MNTTETQVTVNEQLVRLDNLINGIEYLYEEQKTRQFPEFDQVQIRNKVEEIINGDNFHRRIREWINRYKLPTMQAEITNELKNLIGPSLDRIVEEKVNARIREMGLVSISSVS